MTALRRVRTPVLEVAYRQSGPDDGMPVLLLHGFPYDIHAFDEVERLVAAAGHRVIVPWLRGYGETRFLSKATMRSGEQAALGRDVLDLLDALHIDRAVLAGYDWGGRAACVVAALWPSRVAGLVTCGGYAIQDVKNGHRPADPAQEHRYWYQYYFHTERGREGLRQNRRELTRLLWLQWSPDWAFNDATLARTTAAFDNPDFVDVVTHSYRHRTGAVAGDPHYAMVEQGLSMMPAISVPTIALHGASDGVTPAAMTEAHERFFTGGYRRIVLDRVGHNVPQEAPWAFADAVLGVVSGR